jgi:carboxymethylenebutenolidase
MRAPAFGIALLALLLLAGCQAEPPHDLPPPAPAGERNVDLLVEGAYPDISTEDVAYAKGFTGFLARPSAPGDYPGVILIHEWWGLNENIKAMARQLAAEGYVALAVDLYREVATTPERARELTSSVKPEAAIANMKSAAAYLRDTQKVTKLASMGWCFGGGQSLQLALNDGLDAAVIYYGRLVTNESLLASIDHPVLGIFGEKDTSITAESARAFDAALDNLGIENEVYIYPGVGHAFANPSGANYAPNETRDAWEKTVAFLDRNLKG